MNSVSRPPAHAPEPRLVFAPLAWLKLQLFCHLGQTEIGGFGIGATDNLLRVEDFITVRQHTSTVSVAMDDQAVADFVDRCIDAGLAPQQCCRLWCHTHPGSSPEPSATDEATFERVFGACDWAVMFILSRTSQCYARLSLRAGPGAMVPLSVAVDWSAWPDAVARQGFSWPDLFTAWQQEFAANIQPLAATLPALMDRPAAPSSPSSPSDDFAGAFVNDWNWDELDYLFLEDLATHEPACDPNFRT